MFCKAAIAVFCENTNMIRFHDGQETAWRTMLIDVQTYMYINCSDAALSCWLCGKQGFKKVANIGIKLYTYI